MINIDTRLFKSINADQLWLLCQIVKRFDERLSCWPSNKTLCKDTGWSLKKLQAVKSDLIEKKLLVSSPRFKSDKQSSNEYRIKTEYMAVFVSVDKIQVNFEGESEMPTQSDLLRTPQSESSNEVLTIEVLTSSSESFDSVQQQPLFSEEEVLIKGEGQKESKKNARAKKEVDPAYPEFVRVWCEAYPELGFSGMDGKKIKSLIERTKNYLIAGDRDPSAEKAVNMFQYVVNYLKKGETWYAGKDLSIIDSKYLSIIFEIKNGKSKPTKAPSARDIINSL